MPSDSNWLTAYEGLSQADDLLQEPLHLAAVLLMPSPVVLLALLSAVANRLAAGAGHSSRLLVGFGATSDSQRVLAPHYLRLSNRRKGLREVFFFHFPFTPMAAPFLLK